MIWLKKTDIPLTTISKKTGISRSTLYNWLNGLPIRDRNLGKLIDVYNKDIQIIDNAKIDKEDTTASMEARYIIKLQKDKIRYLEKELAEKTVLIKQLKTKGTENINRPHQNTALK